MMLRMTKIVAQFASNLLIDNNIINVQGPSDDSMRPPQFTQKLKNLTVNDGEQLELTVKVDGDPEPQIAWSKNDKVDAQFSNR